MEEGAVSWWSALDLYLSLRKAFVSRMMSFTMC